MGPKRITSWRDCLIPPVGIQPLVPYFCLKADRVPCPSRNGESLLNGRKTALTEPSVYKNLNCDLLGIFGRQNEIIELALTYGFVGIDIDIADLVKRCERSSFETAARFLTSSKLKMGGFHAPIDLDLDDESFASNLTALTAVSEIAGRVDAQAAILEIPSHTDRLPYHEYFDVIRKRIQDIVKVFAIDDIRVALNFNPIKQQDGKQFKFVRDVEGFVALTKSCQNVGIVFDSWAWFCGGGTEDHLEQLGIDKVRIVRIADCAEGVAPHAATADDCWLPGTTGIIDNLSYLRKLQSSELSLPVAARGRLPDTSATREAVVGKAQDALDKIFSEAGLPTQTRKPEMFLESGYASN